MTVTLFKASVADEGRLGHATGIKVSHLLGTAPAAQDFPATIEHIEDDTKASDECGAEDSLRASSARRLEAGEAPSHFLCAPSNPISPQFGLPWKN